LAGSFVIRPAALSEVDTILGWASSEGWNPGLADAEPFHSADPGGFLFGLLDGEPITCISVVRYGANYGFLGFYICRPEFRGRGYGWKTWRAGMNHLAGRTIGLDGVVAQQGNYAKSGFALAHRNIRHGGKAGAPSAPSPNIRKASPDDTLLKAIFDYDRPFFPAPRKEFLRLWLSPPRRTFVHVKDGALRGYGTIRECGEGYKIGPLFADDEGIAAELFSALRSAVPPAETVFLDVPEPNEAAQRLARSAGLTPVFETARMYRGPAPALPLSRIFGITTFELG